PLNKKGAAANAAAPGHFVVGDAGFEPANAGKFIIKTYIYKGKIDIDNALTRPGGTAETRPELTGRGKMVK
ncbi:MAG: hypothetical protein AB1921_12775, partial [Thermodesulfobacteriota bacterium]